MGTPGICTGNYNLTVSEAGVHTTCLCKVASTYTSPGNSNFTISKTGAHGAHLCQAPSPMNGDITGYRAGVHGACQCKRASTHASSGNSDFAIYKAGACGTHQYKAVAVHTSHGKRNFTVSRESRVVVTCTLGVMASLTWNPVPGETSAQ